MDVATKSDLHALVDQWESDPDGFQACDNLCTVLANLPGQPEGEYSPDAIREMIDASNLPD